MSQLPARRLAPDPLSFYPVVRGMPGFLAGDDRMIPTSSQISAIAEHAPAKTGPADSKTSMPSVP